MINKNFTCLWVGKIISQLGDKFYAIALAWWILLKTDSPTIMGFFLLVSVLPGILIGLFAGTVTDRLKRKNMLIVTDIVRGCLVLAISYLSYVNLLNTGYVFVIGFCLSIASAFFEPAMQSIIPEIVMEENLVKANAMSQLVGGICTVAGPLFGAVTISMLGVTWVFFINSISFFISALLTCFIKTPGAYRESSKKNSIWQDMLEGIRFIMNQKRIIAVLKVIAMAHLFVGGLTVLLPFLAKELAGKGVNNLGLLEMMLGAGLLCGAIRTSMKKNSSVTERALYVLLTIVGGCFVIISLLQYRRIETVFVYLPVMMLIGICISSASVFWQSLLQSYTPNHMTGRVFCVSTLIGNTSLPIAYGLFGMLLNSSSVKLLIGICGVCLIALSVLMNIGKFDKNS